MARVCEACGRTIVQDDYYDIMITPKDPAKPPDQDADNVYGDFCLTCTRTGRATKALLKEYEKSDAEKTTGD